MAAFTNKATLSYNGVTKESNVVSGQIASALTMEKTALAQSYRGGDTVTYIITLVNNGEAPLAQVTVTDDLGAYEWNGLTLVPLTYVEGSAKLIVNGVPTEGLTAEAGEGLTFSGFGIPAGGSAVIVYEAQLNGYAPLAPSSTVVNTAAVGDETAGYTLTAAGEAELDITKSVSPSSVAPDGTLTYTFVITNSGASAAGVEENAVLSDTFDPVLSDIVVTMDGAALQRATGYSYDDATGEFSTLPGVISVPAATYSRDAATGEWTVTPGSVTITVSGTV